MADPRWTPETEALAAKVIARAVSFDIDCAGPGEANAATEEHAFAVLDALAEAGVLLPPTADVRTEWGVRHPTLGVDGPVVSRNGDNEALARRIAAASGNLALVRRAVLTDTGPWTEATP